MQNNNTTGIITTKYALHEQYGECRWIEAGNTISYARTLRRRGWILMEYDIDTGWKRVAAPKYYNTQKRMAATGGRQ